MKDNSKYSEYSQKISNILREMNTNISVLRVIALNHENEILPDYIFSCAFRLVLIDARKLVDKREDTVRILDLIKIAQQYSDVNFDKYKEQLEGFRKRDFYKWTNNMEVHCPKVPFIIGQSNVLKEVFDLVELVKEVIVVCDKEVLGLEIPRDFSSIHVSGNTALNKKIKSLK